MLSGAEFDRCADGELCRITYRCLLLFQELINNASSYLYAATNQRAFFGDVTVVVPSSWPRSCTGSVSPGQATTESYLTSDLRVSSAHPVHGTAPWTHQSGLCGQPGAFVQFAAEYVASDQPGEERGMHYDTGSHKLHDDLYGHHTLLVTT